MHITEIFDIRENDTIYLELEDEEADLRDREEEKEKWE